MRTKMARTNMEVSDKLTGKIYKITDVKLTGAAPVAEAEEIIDENEAREPEKIVITPDNDITFKVVKWIDDDTIYTDIQINAGALVIDGDPVVMGECIAKRIIRTLPGQIIFAAEIKDDEENDMLYAYQPLRDKFTQLCPIPVKETTTIEESPTRTILGYSYTKEEEKVDENGKKTMKTVFDRAGLIVITNRKGYALDLDGDDKILGYDFEHAVMANGAKYLYVPIIPSSDRSNGCNEYVYFHVTNVATEEEWLEMPDRLEKVTRNRSSANIGSDVYTGKTFLKIGDYAEIKVPDADQFPYLVDYHDEGREEIFVMASADRNLRTVRVRHTSDRGDIVTIE